MISICLLDRVGSIIIIIGFNRLHCYHNHYRNHIFFKSCYHDYSCNREKYMTCYRNHNRNRYSKSTVIMIILNRNHDFLSIYHNK